MTIANAIQVSAVLNFLVSPSRYADYYADLDGNYTLLKISVWTMTTFSHRFTNNFTRQNEQQTSMHSKYTNTVHAFTILT